VPHLCGFYPDICLVTEEKAGKNLSDSDFSMAHSNISQLNIIFQTVFAIWVSHAKINLHLKNSCAVGRDSSIVFDPP
jgi:fumarate reductase subunit D